MTAGYLFDDAADAHDGDGDIGAESVAMAALLMAQSFELISRIHPHPDDVNVGSVLQTLARHCARSATGQFLRLRSSRLGTIDLDEAMAQARLRSGSIGCIATRLGVCLTTTQPWLIKALSDFGSNLFTCSQLVDDARDARLEDLRLNRKTVPVVYFQQLRNLDASAPTERPLSGAETLCLLAAEIELGQARKVTTELEARGFEADPLLQLVSAASDEIRKAFVGIQVASYS